MKDDNNKWIKIGILGYNLEFEEVSKIFPGLKYRSQTAKCI